VQDGAGPLSAAAVEKLLREAGADPALATAEWAAHHLAMVTWKCARHERSHPPLRGRLLTAPIIVDQLLRRSDPALHPVLKRVCLIDRSQLLSIFFCHTTTS